MDRGYENLALRAAYMTLAGSRAAALGSRAFSTQGRWAVLYYHSVKDCERAAFRRQARAMAGGATAVSEIGGAAFTGDPRVGLTFDDGFACLMVNAVPALVEYGVPATVFVVSGMLGKTPSWAMPGGHRDAGERMMTAGELRRLPRDLVSLGSHTVTHPRLDRVSSDEVRRELRDSRNAIQDVVGRPVEALAFPHGAYTPECIEIAYELGYRQLFTIDACAFPGPLKHGLIGRFHVAPLESLLELRLKMMGAYDWLFHVRRAKRCILSRGTSCAAAGD